VARFFILHLINLVVEVVSFYSVAITMSQLWGLFLSGTPLGLFSILLVYMGCLCLILLPIQLGLGVYAFSHGQEPSFLLLVYFQYDQKKLPSELLDPTESKIGVVVLVILLAGGFIALPVFFLYGSWLIGFLIIGSTIFTPEDLVHFINSVLINVLSPALGIPLLVLCALITISIITFERRHHSK
jgi:hypothetical protein